MRPASSLAAPAALALALLTPHTHAQEPQPVSLRVTAPAAAPLRFRTVNQTHQLLELGGEEHESLVHVVQDFTVQDAGPGRVKVTFLRAHGWLDMPQIEDRVDFDSDVQLPVESIGDVLALTFTACVGVPLTVEMGSSGDVGAVEGVAAAVQRAVSGSGRPDLDAIVRESLTDETVREQLLYTWLAAPFPEAAVDGRTEWKEKVRVPGGDMIQLDLRLTHHVDTVGAEEARIVTNGKIDLLGPNGKAVAGFTPTESEFAGHSRVSRADGFPLESRAQFHFVLEFPSHGAADAPRIEQTSLFSLVRVTGPETADPKGLQSFEGLDTGVEGRVWMAQRLVTASRHAEARAILEPLLLPATAAAAAETPAGDAHHDLARIFECLAKIHEHEGDLARTRERLGQASRLYAKLSAAHPEGVALKERVVDLDMRCAELAWSAGDVPAALGALGTAVAVLEESFANHGRDEETAASLVRTLVLRARIHAGAGDLDPAAASIDRALELEQDGVGAALHPRDVAALRMEAAEISLRKGRWAEAITRGRAARAAFEAVSSRFDGYGFAAERCARIAEGAALLANAREPADARGQLALGVVLLLRREPDKALVHLQKALEDKEVRADVTGCALYDAACCVSLQAMTAEGDRLKDLQVQAVVMLSEYVRGMRARIKLLESDRDARDRAGNELENLYLQAKWARERDPFLGSVRELPAFQSMFAE